MKTMGNSEQILLNSFAEFKSAIKPKLILSFDSLDGAVSELVTKTQSGKLQNRYFDAALEIKNQREDLLFVFSSELNKAFAKFIAGNYNFTDDNKEEKKPELQLDTLSLVEDNILDEFLACSNMVSKTEINCNNNLFGIEQRFAKLISKPTLKTKQVPISPEVIVTAYRKSVGTIKTKIDLDIHFRLLLYIIFDRNVLASLNEIYNHINNFLVSKGVIEKISYGLGDNAETQPDKEDNFEDIDDNIVEKFNSLDETVPIIKQALKQVVDDVDIQEIDSKSADKQSSTTLAEDIDESYNLISQLLKTNLQQHGDGDAQNTPIASSDSVTNQVSGSSSSAEGLGQTQIQPANIDSMVQALSSIQNVIIDDTKSYDFSDINSSPEQIKTDFIQQLAKANNNSTIKNNDMEAIDLIVLLFKYIIDDRNLPDAIQVILSHLQIPYLKIALQDRTLFSDKKHPARKLLNTISIASVGWSKETDEDHSFIDKIHEVAKKILVIETYEEDFFKDLLVQFNNFYNDNQDTLKKSEDEANEKLHKQEKLTLAKKQAANILIGKMTNKQMPALFKDILLGSWLYIMVLTETKYARISKEYDDRIEFVDKLIKYAQVNINSIVTDEHIKELSKKYYDGLKLVTFNKDAILKKLLALKKCLNGIHLNTNKQPNKAVEPQEIIDLAEIRNHKLGIVQHIKEEEESAAINEKIDIKPEHIDVVKSLQTGKWLEFTNNDSTATRAKLSWISPITGKYLFVQSNGLKYNDMTPQIVALGLENGTISIIDAVPLFDRAMTTIAGNLQAKTA